MADYTNIEIVLEIENEETYLEVLDGISMVVQYDDLEQQVRDALSPMFGSPLTASTAAGMTDQTKVYVYTGSETGYTAGNWYYYNGSSWVSGGVYNSVAVQTDKTLTIADKAADAKKTGDELTDLKSAIGEKVPFPEENPFGEQSQFLRSNGDGTTEWVDYGIPTHAQTALAIATWLNSHPEATTTVEDGSITFQKFHDDVVDIIDGKAPIIVATTEEQTNQSDLGFGEENTVNIKSFDNNIYGNALIADDVNLFDVSSKQAITKNGVTITPRSNNSFFLNGTATGVSLAKFEAVYDDPELKPIEGETVIIKVFTTHAIRLLIGVTGKELRDITISTTNELVNITITKTVPADANDYHVTFASTSGTVFSNDIVWIGIYHEGTTFSDLEDTPPITTKNKLLKLNTLFYPNVTTYFADTKTYIDKLDIDINEKLTYATPERFFGGDIPQNIDAQPYILQAIEYAKTNNVPVVCGKTYYTSTPLVISAQNLNIYINKLTYNASTGYAIILRGRANILTVTYLVSNAGGVNFHPTGNTSDTAVRSNIVQIGRLQSAGHCLLFDAEDGVVDGSCSYNYIQCNALSSTNGNAIRCEGSSGCSENVFFGGETRTSNNYAFYLNGSAANYFYNFCLESYTYQGIVLYGNNNHFSNFRTSECQNTCDNNGRTFIKLVGTPINNIFHGLAPRPYGIDVSELVIPPENTGSSQSGWQYGLFVSQFVLGTDSIPTIRRSTYYGSQYLYYNDVGAWTINLEGKIIHKLAKPSLLTVEVSTVDMSEETECNYFVVDTMNSIITLSPSYCADGISEIYIEQKNGYKATIYNDENTLIFNGTSLTDGVYKIEFIAQLLPYTPSTKTYYTWFYGKGSAPKISKVDAI